MAYDDAAIEKDGHLWTAHVRHEPMKQLMQEAVIPVMRLAADVYLSIAAGYFKEIPEVCAKYNICEDREMTTAERNIRIAFLALPLVGGILGKIGKHAVRVADGVDHTADVVDKVDGVLRLG